MRLFLSILMVLVSSQPLHAEVEVLEAARAPSTIEIRNRGSEGTYLRYKVDANANVTLEFCPEGRATCDLIGRPLSEMELSGILTDLENDQRNRVGISSATGTTTFVATLFVVSALLKNTRIAQKFGAEGVAGISGFVTAPAAFGAMYYALGSEHPEEARSVLDSDYSSILNVLRGSGTAVVYVDSSLEAMMEQWSHVLLFAQAPEAP